MTTMSVEKRNWGPGTESEEEEGEEEEGEEDEKALRSEELLGFALSLCQWENKGFPNHVLVFLVLLQHQLPAD